MPHGIPSGLPVNQHLYHTFVCQAVLGTGSLAAAPVGFLSSGDSRSGGRRRQVSQQSLQVMYLHRWCRHVVTTANCMEDICKPPLVPVSAPLPRWACPVLSQRWSVHSKAALLKKQSKPESSPHTAWPLHASVCIFHRPAFLGDNYISVCIDAPNSFQQQQTDNNSKNLYLLCVCCLSKHIIYMN